LPVQRNGPRDHIPLWASALFCCPCNDYYAPNSCACKSNMGIVTFLSKVVANGVLAPRKVQFDPVMNTILFTSVRCPQNRDWWRVSWPWLSTLTRIVAPSTTRPCRCGKAAGSYIQCSHDNEQQNSAFRFATNLAETRAWNNSQDCGLGECRRFRRG
jgi:hypothetical protein